jgi:hypothetical protein
MWKYKGQDSTFFPQGGRSEGSYEMEEGKGRAGESSRLGDFTTERLRDTAKTCKTEFLPFSR